MPDVSALGRIYRALARSEAVETPELSRVLDSDLAAHQFTTLAFRLYRRSTEYAPLLQPMVHRAMSAAPYLGYLCPRLVHDDIGRLQPDDPTAKLLDATARNTHIGRTSLAQFIRGVVDDTVAIPIQALWLEKVFQDGLSDSDVEDLTLLMRDSGPIYDYRDRLELDQRRIIRRYPTGALSEKTALVLPSLLSAFREHPIASPFLVARSLSYTGGTWDKLRAIPGFTFLSHGSEAIQAMKECGVTMAATSDEVDPADRKLYQLRSVTGTVESPELIIASIASKQLAIPADFLLLDVRFGDGAFLETRSLAEAVADRIVELLRRHGMGAASVFTDTPQPNGMSVGNSLEVLEAIALMGGPARIPWDSRAIAEQKALVVGFFASLMTHELGPASGASWESRALQKFEGGDVFHAFRNLLRVHRVPEAVRDAIASAPEDLLLPKGQPLSVRAPKGGTLVSIDQPQLGDFVNQVLGAGGNDYAGTFNAKAGVLLTKRLGDRVETGEVMAFVYAGGHRADVTPLHEAFGLK